MPDNTDRNWRLLTVLTLLGTCVASARCGYLLAVADRQRRDDLELRRRRMEASLNAALRNARARAGLEPAPELEPNSDGEVDVADRQLTREEFVTRHRAPLEHAG